MATRLTLPVANSCVNLPERSATESKQRISSESSHSVSLISGHQASCSGRLFARGLKSKVPIRNLSGKKAIGVWRNSPARGGVETEAVAADSSSVKRETEPARPAVDIVYEFYDGINNRDYERVAELFADECAYEDFNFAQPAKGKEEVMKFFKRIVPALGTEFMFVIDDITRGDPDAVGVLWHLDWRGKAIPNGRGCSFYRCEMNSSGVRQIKYARDIVEPPAKPGFIAMGALRLIAALLKRFPQLGNGF